MQSRYYDPEVGRFINADAAEFTAMATASVNETNLLAYCSNNPVNESDPTGFFCWSNVIGGFVGGVTNLVTGIIAGDSFGKVAVSVLAGTVSGAVKSNELTLVCNAISAVVTTVECYKSGASLGTSILCGAATFGTSMIAGEKLGQIIGGMGKGTIKAAAEGAIDLTLGLAAKSTATATARVIQEISEPRQIAPKSLNYFPAWNSSRAGSSGFTVSKSVAVMQAA